MNKESFILQYILAARSSGRSLETTGYGTTAAEADRNQDQLISSASSLYDKTIKACEEKDA